LDRSGKILGPWWVSVSITTVSNLVSQGCRDHSWADPPIGPSVNDLAAAVERGTETYDVTVREVIGDERDRIYAEQARRYPGFAEYERQTEGLRTIPVIELGAPPPAREPMMEWIRLELGSASYVQR
jgi:hypothetical protein